MLKKVGSIYFTLDISHSYCAIIYYYLSQKYMCQIIHEKYLS